MIPKIPILKEVSYKEYSENCHRQDVTYVRYMIIDNDIKEPSKIAKFVNSNLEDKYNTDIHKYFKLLGIISSEAQEKEEDRLNNLSIQN